jgi:hypothetical protein
MVPSHLDNTDKHKNLAYNSFLVLFLVFAVKVADTYYEGNVVTCCIHGICF